MRVRKDKLRLVRRWGGDWERDGRLRGHCDKLAERVGSRRGHRGKVEEVSNRRRTCSVVVKYRFQLLYPNRPVRGKWELVCDS